MKKFHINFDEPIFVVGTGEEGEVTGYRGHKGFREVKVTLDNLRFRSYFSVSEKTGKVWGRDIWFENHNRCHPTLRSLGLVD